MAEEKRRYKAVIADKTYTIVGPGSLDHFAAVTEALNQQLAQINRLAPDLSQEEAATLLAFNVMSDQLKADAAKQLTEGE